jgi:hypothetical protein
VTSLIGLAFLPRGSVLGDYSPNCSGCALLKAARSEQLPEKVRAGAGVIPSSSI